MIALGVSVITVPVAVGYVKTYEKLFIYILACNQSKYNIIGIEKYKEYYIVDDYP